MAPPPKLPSNNGKDRLQTIEEMEALQISGLQRLTEQVQALNQKMKSLGNLQASSENSRHSLSSIQDTLQKQGKLLDSLNSKVNNWDFMQREQAETNQVLRNSLNPEHKKAIALFMIILVWMAAWAGAKIDSSYKRINTLERRLQRMERLLGTHNR